MKNYTPERFQGITPDEFYKFFTGFDKDDLVEFADPCDPYAIHPSTLGVFSPTSMDEAQIMVNLLERYCKNHPKENGKYDYYFAQANNSYMNGDSVGYKKSIDKLLQEIKFE